MNISLTTADVRLLAAVQYARRWSRDPDPRVYVLGHGPARCVIAEPAPTEPAVPPRRRLEIVR